jgi:hypothetical protein
MAYASEGGGSAASSTCFEGKASLPADPRCDEGEGRVGEDGLLRELLQPSLHCCHPTPTQEGQPVLGNQCLGCGQFAASNGVMDGVLDVAGLAEPSSRPLVQNRDDIPIAVGQLQSQELGEQVVIAVPAAIVIERDEELVAVFDLGQDSRRVVRTENRIAQRCRESVEDGGMEHEGT